MDHPTKPNNRWFQFSLRGLVLLVTASAVLLWLWTIYVAPYRAESQAAAALQDRGFTITAEPVGPAWLGKLLGNEYLVKVTSCESFRGAMTDADLAQPNALRHLKSLMISTRFVTDEGLVHLEGLPKLQRLTLHDLDVTDEGLEHLKGLANLRYLEVNSLKGTDAGLRHLRGLENLRKLVLVNMKITDVRRAR